MMAESGPTSRRKPSTIASRREMMPRSGSGSGTLAMCVLGLPKLRLAQPQAPEGARLMIRAC
jgi:hypothetical protein